MKTKTISSFVNRLDPALYFKYLADALKDKRQIAKSLTPKQRKLLSELRK